LDHPDHPDPKDQQDQQDPKDQQDRKDQQDHKDRKEHKDCREYKDLKGHEDQRDQREIPVNQTRLLPLLLEVLPELPLVPPQGLLLEVLRVPPQELPQLMPLLVLCKSKLIIMNFFLQDFAKTSM
jgi:hypothetical protein